MFGTEVMPGRLDSLWRFIDIKNSLSREAIGFIAVCFSCDELINSIGLSGLHPTIRVPARPSRKAHNGRGADRLDCCSEALPVHRRPRPRHGAALLAGSESARARKASIPAFDHGARHGPAVPRCRPGPGTAARDRCTGRPGTAEAPSPTSTFRAVTVALLPAQLP